jgi:lysine/ornithine N-monooxygenase
MGNKEIAKELVGIARELTAGGGVTPTVTKMEVSVWQSGTMQYASINSYTDMYEGTQRVSIVGKGWNAASAMDDLMDKVDKYHTKLLRGKH